MEQTNLEENLIRLMKEIRKEADKLKKLGFTVEMDIGLDRYQTHEKRNSTLKIYRTIEIS